MRLHSLVYLCVASYSGGAFFTPMSTHVPDTFVGSFVEGRQQVLSNDDIATHTFFAENTPYSLPSVIADAPLRQAHAHNDYEHERPLFDALAQGFTHIEVDVHLFGGELFVAHATPLFFSQKRTLRILYLEPLKNIVRCNGGSVFPPGDLPLHLMIDIKTDASETYEVLKAYLEPYRPMLTSFEDGTKQEGAVTVFLSGNRPVEQLLAEKSTLACLDGRIEDLGKGIPPDLMPMVSERFSNIFGWEIFGTHRPENQWLTLRRLARLTHAEGKKLRLWASPEKEVVWEKLLASGCDVINTDELGRLRQFLHHRAFPCLAIH